MHSVVIRVFVLHVASLASILVPIYTQRRIIVVHAGRDTGYHDIHFSSISISPSSSLLSSFLLRMLRERNRVPRFPYSLLLDLRRLVLFPSLQGAVASLGGGSGGLCARTRCVHVDICGTEGETWSVRGQRYITKCMQYSGQKRVSVVQGSSTVICMGEARLR
jgi:hypothetical protein